MSFNRKCYYRILGLEKNASTEEIKNVFRQLSKETHPDVAKMGCPKKNMERFKEIAEAHSVLSNAKERRRYDLEMSDRFWYQNGRGGGGGGYSSPFHHADHPTAGPKASGGYAVLETIFRPRNFVMGLTLGICSVMAYQSFFMSEAEQNKRQMMRMQRHGGGGGTSQLVEAWKNPTTGRWEQAAPWDPTYRRLKPTLHMVPREKVQSRTR